MKELVGICLILLLAGMGGCGKGKVEAKPQSVSAPVAIQKPPQKPPLTPAEHEKLLRAKAKEKNLGFEVWCGGFGYDGWAWPAGHHKVYAENGAVDDWFVLNEPSRDMAVQKLYEAISDEPNHPAQHDPDRGESKKHIQCDPPLMGGPQQ